MKNYGYPSLSEIKWDDGNTKIKKTDRNEKPDRKMKTKATPALWKNQTKSKIFREEWKFLVIRKKLGKTQWEKIWLPKNHGYVSLSEMKWRKKEKAWKKSVRTEKSLWKCYLSLHKQTEMQEKKTKLQETEKNETSQKWKKDR